MRVGLLGGSFNPIHYGHLAIAAHTRDAMGLDRVLFIPTGEPPHKAPDSLAPATHRQAMVELAIRDEPSFQLSDIELQRSGTSYSIDTVHDLQARLGSSARLYFIIGLDAFVEVRSWKDPDRLLGLCHFVVVSRPQTRFTQLGTMPLFRTIDTDKLDALDSGHLRRLSLDLTGGGSLTLLTLPPCEVSASEIRRRARKRERLTGLLPPPVESYIIRHGLYLEDSDRTGI